MNEYYPIFILAFLYVVFASIQDIRKREVANWVNFSLLTFVLAYRLFYGIFNDDYNFFIYSLVGVILFMGLANLFYYTRVFAGGDAKLLIAFGAIVPFNSWYSIIYLGFSFIFLLFLVGAVYSLVYSSVLALSNFVKFKKEFKQNMKKYIVYFVISFILALFLVVEYNITGWRGALSYYSIGFLLLIPFIFVFLKSVEN
ncbi:MAG: A24 family peptidase, partial [archaeon]